MVLSFQKNTFEIMKILFVEIKSSYVMFELKVLKAEGLFDLIFFFH
jgi:hypothetical protein